MEIFFTILGAAVLTVLCVLGVAFIAAVVIAYYDMIENEKKAKQ